MFDGGSMTLDRDAVLDTRPLGGPREADWKALHQRLRGIAKRRVALEAEEASYLVEAEDLETGKVLVEDPPHLVDLPGVAGGEEDAVSHR